MKTAIVLTRTALSCAGVDQDLVEMARFVQVIDWEQMSSRIVKLWDRTFRLVVFHSMYGILMPIFEGFVLFFIIILL